MGTSDNNGGASNTVLLNQSNSQNAPIEKKIKNDAN